MQSASGARTETTEQRSLVARTGRDTASVVRTLDTSLFVQVVVQWRYKVPLLKNFGRNSVGRKMGRLRVRSCYWGKTFVFKGYSQS